MDEVSVFVGSPFRRNYYIVFIVCYKTSHIKTPSSIMAHFYDFFLKHLSTFYKFITMIT